jgi:hypothetical protein
VQVHFHDYEKLVVDFKSWIAGGQQANQPRMSIIGNSKSMLHSCDPVGFLLR